MLEAFVFASRTDFNFASKQITSSIKAIEEIEHTPSISLYGVLKDCTDSTNQAASLPLVSLVAEKFQYSAISVNLGAQFSTLEEIKALLATIRSHDVLVAIHHPLTGIHFLGDEEIQVRLERNRLLVVYARNLNPGLQAEDALKSTTDLLRGFRLFILKKGAFNFQPYLVKPEGLVSKPILAAPPRPAVAPQPSYARAPQRQPAPQQPAPQAPSVPRPPQYGYGGIPSAQPARPAQPATGGSSPSVAAQPTPSPMEKVMSEAAAAVPITGKPVISPPYGVQVTNELFHNGNVEAWKNIIDSYNLKHPDAEVMVYHKDEKILNLNSLFKWGKVKHGDAIVFRVKAVELKDLSKLKRYLFEGASNRFEKFLHKELNGYLRLF